MPHNPQGLGFKLTTEKSWNLTKLHGAQDAVNKISYTKWARQIKDFVESKGGEGIEIVKAMRWAETQDRHTQITNAEIAMRYPDIITSHTLTQLHIRMQTWAGGSAEKVIMYNMRNGFDAWRKLYCEQLPEANHRAQLLVNEFHKISAKLTPSWNLSTGSAKSKGLQRYGQRQRTKGYTSTSK